MADLDVLYTQVLARLQGVQRRGSYWMARCPAHDDQRSSLQLSVGDQGGLRLHCHAGCDFRDVMSATGLPVSAFLPPRDGTQRPVFKIVAEYDYRDEAGRLLYQSVRLDPKDFRQRRPAPGGGWIWGLTRHVGEKGKRELAVRQVLYRLPELPARPNDPVFVVEGEKDADNLAKLGLLATCNAGGAGKWLADYSKTLTGRHVVVIPDRDHAGKEHAIKVLGSLLWHQVATARLLVLPGGPKSDVSDWLAAGGTRDDLVRLAKAAPKYARQATAASAVRAMRPA